ncbi:MAG TPA: 2-phosphosulfolactate phosphatase [Bacteroidia bacterium]|jgi:2-phosphosulfolactate phosphatase|nr:2-phosphosulfolactate phosphatase [Bacteroidia bacterium]
MTKRLTIDVCVSPYLYPVYHREETIVVIIDILRATSAMCTAFHYGVDKMIPVATIEEAMDYKQQGFLVGAERNGIQLEGVDFGNSPYSYMSEKIKGKTIVLSTTNGTQAIEVSKHAHKVVIGSFVNMTALCKWLQVQNKNILLLCSGWKNRVSLEDTLFAGAVTEQLVKNSDSFKTGDGALSASYLFESARHNPYKYMRNASHAERLAALGLKEDIRYCLTPDQTNVIPVLEGKYLVKMS